MNIGKKTLSAGSTLFAVSLVLSGCGDSSSGGSTEVTDTNPVATTPGATNPVATTPDATTPDTTTPVATTPEVTNPIDVSDASLLASVSKTTGGATNDNAADFKFPAIDAANGGFSMVIPGSPAPEFAARRTIVEGGGQTIGFGQPVILKYDMFSWTDGSLVDSSSQFAEAHTVTAGVTDDFPIPEYIAKSFLGRSLGDVVQVVIPKGTEDLPDYLDKNDAYVLVMEMM